MTRDAQWMATGDGGRMTNAAPLETAPFQAGERENFSALREHFQRSGFSESAVHEALEGRIDRNTDVQFVMRRTAGASPFNHLLRLFVLGIPLREEIARAALEPLDFDWMIDSGLIVRMPEGVRSAARLLPWRHLFLLSDFPPPAGVPFRTDFVMSGSSPSSVSLTKLTPRNRVATALDVGCGAGIHALLAAGHADWVIATDINPRALNFAAMNARLNGIHNVSFAAGSFFEPVCGEKFDLIVTNPPFIICPRSNLIFQNPGLGGDGVSELIIREAPGHLNEGGRAISLISWSHETGEDWALRPSAWAAGSGCDFWLLKAVSEDPLDYAGNALRQTQEVQEPRYGELLDEWTAWYREQKISRLALGAAILRKRRSPRNWVHCEKLGGAALSGDAGGQVERVFAAEDLLESLPKEEALLDRRLALHPDHLIEQKLIAGEGGWISQSLILLPSSGIEHRAEIDARVLAFLSECDGSRTIRELIADVARKDGVEFGEAASAGLPLVRRLLRAGFLVEK